MGSVGDILMKSAESTFVWLTLVKNWPFAKFLLQFLKCRLPLERNLTTESHDHESRIMTLTRSKFQTSTKTKCQTNIQIIKGLMNSFLEVYFVCLSECDHNTFCLTECNRHFSDNLWMQNEIKKLLSITNRLNA